MVARRGLVLVSPPEQLGATPAAQPHPGTLDAPLYPAAAAVLSDEGGEVGEEAHAPVLARRPPERQRVRADTAEQIPASRPTASLLGPEGSADTVGDCVAGRRTPLGGS